MYTWLWILKWNILQSHFQEKKHMNAQCLIKICIVFPLFNHGAACEWQVCGGSERWSVSMQTRCMAWACAWEKRPETLNERSGWPLNCCRSSTDSSVYMIGRFFKRRTFSPTLLKVRSYSFVVYTVVFNFMGVCVKSSSPKLNWQSKDWEEQGPNEVLDNTTWRGCL